MATPATFSHTSISHHHQQQGLIIDRAGIVSLNSPFPYDEVDVSHFDKMVISDDWGSVRFPDLLRHLYFEFAETTKALDVNAALPKIYEVGSSAAYDAYNPHRELLNASLPDDLKAKAKDIDLLPSFDHDLRFELNKHVIARAEELFLATLNKICPNFNQKAFKWKERIYDHGDNITVLSIKDKAGQQYDFYFYETTKREFFASRDAAQLDVTPYITEGKKAKLIVKHYHPIQPYKDRIDRILRVPEPEKVNHHGFLLQIYYGMKNYVNPDPNAENCFKRTLLDYLKTHNLNDLISKFIANHPSDNGYAFIFSVRSRLGHTINSPIQGYTSAQLSVCAQLISPTDRKLILNNQAYFLDAPKVSDLTGFDWNCPLLANLNVLNILLEFEKREPLNPVAKTMFDSYLASLKTDEQRSSAMKLRVLYFSSTDRRSHVIMQTIAAAKSNMSSDLLSVVANFADESQYESIIGSLSKPEWIVSNPEKAVKVLAWMLQSNSHKERVYPFLRHLIPICNPALISDFVQKGWNHNPSIKELLDIKEVIEKRGIDLPSIFSSYEESMSSLLGSSKDFISVLGLPKTLKGKIDLFRIYAKEDRQKAIKYACDAGISDKVYGELLLLFRATDTNLDDALVSAIVSNCPATQYETLTNNLPLTWLAAHSEKAEDAFNWLIKERKRLIIYPFLNALIKQCPFVDSSDVIVKAWSIHPDIHELLKLNNIDLPSLFRSRELEVLPYVKGLSSENFRKILGEPTSEEGKIALYSILCRENAKAAIEYSERTSIPAAIVDQFLKSLESGSDADRISLKTYLASLSYENRIAYWKSWLQTSKSPLESPLFSWVLSELTEKHNQSLFLALVRIALPHSAHILTNLKSTWISENPSVVTRILDIFSKDRTALSSFLHRLVEDDSPEMVPQHLKRLWDLDQDVHDLCALQPVLAKRGLKLSCVFPLMEKDLNKPFGKTLHEFKKNFDETKFTRMVELGHPNHLDAITHLALANPTWIAQHSEEALNLFGRLVAAGKQTSVQSLLPELFRNIDTNNFQDCFKKAWPIVKKAKIFLEHKTIIQNRGVSLATILRPLEEEVLASLEDQADAAGQAEAIFSSIESAKGKRIYLSYLLKATPEKAEAYAKANGLEVDLLEMAKGPLSIAVLNDKQEWSQDEQERLWAIAEIALCVPLVQILLPRSKSGFERVLKLLAKSPSSIKEAEPLYPHIIKESASCALPFILANSCFDDATKAEMPRLLKEASLEEKLSLLKWMQSFKHSIVDYVRLDQESYNTAFSERLDNANKFGELYSIVGPEPFVKLWEARPLAERVELTRCYPHIFKHPELRALLNPIRDNLFSGLSLKAIEALDIEPSTKDQYFICFASPSLFDRHYPKFYENFGHRTKNKVSPAEYVTVLDYLINYKSRHVLTALGYRDDFCGNIIARSKDFIDAGVPFLGTMHSQEEKDFYQFAKLQRYLPNRIVEHFINTGNFEWFKEGLDLLSTLPPNNESDLFPLIVLKGIVRFEKEFSTIPANALMIYCTVFSTGTKPFEAFECLRNATIPYLKELCRKHLVQILRDWSKHPKSADKKSEASVGGYIAECLTSDLQSRDFVTAEPMFSLLKGLPHLEKYYTAQFCEGLLKTAQKDCSVDEMLDAANTVSSRYGEYFYAHPKAANKLVNDYVAILSKLFDQKADLAKLNVLCFQFFYMLIEPKVNIKDKPATLPKITSITKPDNLAQSVFYAVRLLDMLLSKKYADTQYLNFALSATYMFIEWLLGNPVAYKEQILPLLLKRIYFIQCTPEFHYSEFILNNQKLLPLADKILNTAQKSEFALASNQPFPDASLKYLQEKVTAFNNYAENFLAFSDIRPALHVLTKLTEVFPIYKKTRGIKVRQIFSGLIAKAAIDPMQATASGAPFLFKLKDVFREYFKVVHDANDKEHIDDYMHIMKELIKTFYATCETLPEKKGIYSDLLSMLEFENYFQNRYDVYFELCEMVFKQWISVVDNHYDRCMDPMTVLIGTQQNDKFPEKFSERRSKCLEKWFEALCGANKKKFVQHLIDEYQFVSKMCTEEMKKKYAS